MILIVCPVVHHHSNLHLHQNELQLGVKILIKISGVLMVC